MTRCCKRPVVGNQKSWYIIRLRTCASSGGVSRFTGRVGFHITGGLIEGDCGVLAARGSVIRPMHRSLPSDSTDSDVPLR